MHAFILAGGFATRLWPLTEKRAKPLLPLVGIPLLTRIIDKIPSGIAVTVSTNPFFTNELETWKETIRRPDVRVRIERVCDGEEKLGALGAVRQWVTDDHIDDDVWILTGDNEFGLSFEIFLRAYDPRECLIAAHDVKERSLARTLGVLMPHGDGLHVAGFEEKPQDPQSTLISTGCSIIPRAHLKDLCTFAAKKPDDIGGVFEEFIRLCIPVRFFRFTEHWHDIGSFEKYLAATKDLVGEHCIRDADVIMTETATRGSTVIGRGSRVRGSTLIDTVLFTHCDIDDCILRDCIIDDGCVLRGIDLTGQMLRAGTRLVRT